LHIVGFHSRKFSMVKINYGIYDKNKLAIINAFEERQHLFEGAQHIAIVYIDHKNLECMNVQILNL
jgi:hypothetical protein